jgi:hypothetical protein
MKKKIKQHLTPAKIVILIIFSYILIETISGNSEGRMDFIFLFFLMGFVALAELTVQGLKRHKPRR